MGDVLLHDGVLLLMCYVKLSALRQLLRYVVRGVMACGEVHVTDRDGARGPVGACEERTRCASENRNVRREARE